MKNITKPVITILCLLAGPNPAYSAENLVEVMLQDPLDEARGYCLDIAGGKGRKRASWIKGMQAHTCYNYTGGILEDQGFDPELISAKANSAFPILTYVCRCHLFRRARQFLLGQCNNADTQTFTLKANGQLVAKANPKLCVTVERYEKERRTGRIAGSRDASFVPSSVR